MRNWEINWFMKNWLYENEMKQIAELIRRPMTQKYNTTQQVNIDNSEKFVQLCLRKFSIHFSGNNCCLSTLLLLFIDFGWFTFHSHIIFFLIYFSLLAWNSSFEQTFLPFISYVVCVLLMFSIFILYFQYFTLVRLLCGPEYSVFSN